MQCKKYYISRCGKCPPPSHACGIPCPRLSYWQYIYFLILSPTKATIHPGIFQNILPQTTMHLLSFILLTKIGEND